MTLDLANVYYLVTSGAALVATFVNLVLYRRSRPNRMQEAIDHSLLPVTHRLQHIDREIEQLHESAAKGEALAKAIDHEVTLQLKELDAKIDALVRHTASMPSGDEIRTLHHRVTEVAKQTAGLLGTLEAQSTQLGLIHSYLLHGGKRD